MALRVTGVLGLDGSGFFQTMTRADAAVKRFSSGVNSALTSRFAALFSVGAIGYAIKRTVEYGGKLTDLASRTGATVEELQRFDMAAKQNGSSLETLIAFWDQLNNARAKALANPNGTQANAFGALGIGANDLANKSAQELTRQIAIKFQTGTNVEELVAPLRAIGGRGAMQLSEAFASGMDAAYQDMTVITAEQADMLDELGDKWDSLTQELTNNLAPAIVATIEGFKKLKDEMTIAATFIRGLFKAIFFKNPKQTGRETADEVTQVAIGVASLRAESDELETKARAERIARRQKRPTTFSAFDTAAQEQISRATPLMTDSLIRTGNFLGTNRNVLETLANRQVMLLVNIERHTRKMADKPESSDDIGIA